MNIDDVVADDSQSDSQNTDKDSGTQTDDLDAILDSIDKEKLTSIDNDYEKGVQKALEPDDKSDDKPATDYDAKVETLLARDDDRAINDAVETVQKMLNEQGVKQPDMAVLGMINQLSLKDERINKAFGNRYSDPKSFQKVLAGVVKSISAEYQDQPDQQLTDDRATVSNSMVRGTTNVTEDDAPNLESMTDQEFDEWKRKQ